jgi:hypothetical protein
VSRRWSLVVMSPRGVATKSLAPGAEVTIGRAADCDVVLDDAQASRVHAVLQVGERCQLVDRGSRNGTVLGARRLAARETALVAAGDLIGIGATVLVLNEVAEPARLFDQATFDARLEAARKKGAPYARLKIRFDGSAGAQVTLSTLDGAAFGAEVARAERLDAALREVLREGDVVAVCDAGVYDVLLADATESDARAIAQRLRARLPDVTVEELRDPSRLPPVVERVDQRAHSG